MEWHERLKIEIQVGQSFKNKAGVVMDVVAKISDNEYHVTDKGGCYTYRDDMYLYCNGYIVTKFGGFGSYPNPRDLSEKILK